MNEMPDGYETARTFAIWMWSAMGVACLCGIGLAVYVLVTS